MLIAAKIVYRSLFAVWPNDKIKRSPNPLKLPKHSHSCFLLLSRRFSKLAQNIERYIWATSQRNFFAKALRKKPNLVTLFIRHQTPPYEAPFYVFLSGRESLKTAWTSRQRKSLKRPVRAPASLTSTTATAWPWSRRSLAMTSIPEMKRPSSTAWRSPRLPTSWSNARRRRFCFNPF